MVPPPGNDRFLPSPAARGASSSRSRFYTTFRNRQWFLRVSCSRTEKKLGDRRITSMSSTEQERIRSCWGKQSVPLAGVLQRPGDPVDGQEDRAQEEFGGTVLAKPSQQFKLDERERVDVGVAPLDRPLQDLVAVEQRLLLGDCQERVACPLVFGMHASPDLVAQRGRFHH